jgi:hypothetical protein
MRDYRDAKAMAHALRKALAANAVNLNHSECLELIAKSFGVETWNILSAKIDAEKPLAPGVSATSEVAAEKTRSCSFCGKSRQQVQKLIAGPAAFICDECVSRCSEIFEGEDLARLLNEDREGALDRLRERSTEALTTYVELHQNDVNQARASLGEIARRLSYSDISNAPAFDKRLAHLNSKTRDELLVIQKNIESRFHATMATLDAAAVILAERQRS